jgi:hypothetical protein
MAVLNKHLRSSESANAESKDQRGGAVCGGQGGGRSLRLRWGTRNKTSRRADPASTPFLRERRVPPVTWNALEAKPYDTA